MADELEEMLGVKVDLPSVHGVKPKMMKQLKEELVYV